MSRSAGIVTGLVGFMLFLFAVGGCAPRPIEEPAEPVAEEDRIWPETGTWAAEELARLTLEQKVSQLFSVPAYGRYTNMDDPEVRKLLDLVEQFGVGGIIFFQGEPHAQAVLANTLQERADIPLLMSQDMEWGAGMRVEGATTFPRTMAIGATRNPELAYAAGWITATEARALGVRHIFAPVADVNNNPLNPIINVRSFGEDPALVAEMVNAFVHGVQDAGAIATIKHFPGHGDTATDSHADLPILPFGPERLDTLELVPFRAAIASGVKSIMTGHLALPRIEPDSTVPASLSPRISTDLLREKLGFEGLVVTDALNMSGVTKNFDTGEIAVRALLAGADMLLMSEDPYAARSAILDAVRAGRITEARIDESVMRILRAKEWLGLQDDRLVDLEQVSRLVGTVEHRVVSEHIARESLTLLRNEGGLLPLIGKPRQILNLTLSDSDDEQVGQYFAEQLRASGGRNVITARTITPGVSQDEVVAVLNEVARHDVVVISAFVYVRAWTGRISLAPDQQALIRQVVRTGKPVILISFGNPYIITGIEPPDTYLAAYSGSEASQKAVAQALFGKSPVHGRLPIEIPGLYAFGEGMDLEQVIPREGYPEEIGMIGEEIGRIDSLMIASIDSGGFPGAALAVGRDGVIVTLDGYGYSTSERGAGGTPESVLDLAALTKVIATTTAAMKLFEEGRLDLDAPVVRYLPAFGQNGKERVTIRQLLTHTSGLIPFRPFHTEGLTGRKKVIDAIMAEPLIYEPDTESRYSDLGLITLALVIERITGRDFGSYVREEIFEPLGMVSTGFRGVGVTDSTIVPTEYDATFRKRLVQGEVHDETAWILGGTAGHAGLFSTAEDLVRFAYMLANEGRFGGQQFLKAETIRLFTTPFAPDLHTRALGWDSRSPEGYSSAGALFGPRSFGHTGFTGTSIWIDPDQRLFVILLTNRVYPTRNNQGITAVRPQVADLSYGSIAGSPRPLLLDRLSRTRLLTERD